MQTNQEIFILVAEELSVSRAAERAFVSQQCVSDHIKRMEAQCGLRLFTRNPRFQLTEAGETMLRALRKVQAVERDLHQQMQERAAGKKGSFTLGISASRAQVLLPQVLAAYYVEFPEVEIRFVLNDTVISEQRLRQGELDLFLGVNTRYSPDLRFLPICEDALCFIISRGLLEKHFGAAFPGFIASGVDLHDFERVPFINNYATSAANLDLQDLMDAQQISLHSPYQISDTDTQISLCGQGLGAGIGSRMLLSRIHLHNARCEQSAYIHILPIKNFKKLLRVDLVSLRDIEQPLYIRRFEEMVVERVQETCG